MTDTDDANQTRRIEDQTGRATDVGRAADEVAGLKESVLTLAETIGKSLSAEQVATLMARVRLLLIVLAVLAVLEVVTLLYYVPTISSLRDEVRAGHEEIVTGVDVSRCILLIPIEEHTVEKLEACGLTLTAVETKRQP
jgi:hypothetical protein